MREGGPPARTHDSVPRQAPGLLCPDRSVSCSDFCGCKHPWGGGGVALEQKWGTKSEKNCGANLCIGETDGRCVVLCHFFRVVGMGGLGSGVGGEGEMFVSLFSGGQKLTRVMVEIHFGPK